MRKFMTRAVIAVALMPVGYVLGIMLAFGIVDFVGLMSLEPMPTPIAAKPPAPTQINPAPPPQAPQIVPPPVSQEVVPRSASDTRQGIYGAIPPALCREKKSGCGCNTSCEKQI
jgi:hypothetical protein